ncbi:MFS monocarboxylate [Colletotrichum kahawae]|uniref:MFS monocarboxylate n=1 Tax=Colletotrichum kahawae TaxID=34407 RepID=A0AAE0DDM0_COLKA|nr:MFS monocarboxylate [Colletotrichum kahawae]
MGATPTRDNNARVEEQAETQEEIKQTKARYTLILIAAFMINFIVGGLLFGYGVYQALYETMIQEESSPFAGASYAEIDLIGSVSVSVMMMGAPFVVAWVKNSGPKLAICTGGILFGLAHVLASFGTALWHFEMSQGLLLGIGCSLSFLPSVTVAPTWFDKHRGLAVGFVSAGTGVGGLVWAPAITAAVKAIGFRSTLRMTGALSAFLIVLSGLSLSWEPSMAAHLREEKAKDAHRKGIWRIPLPTWETAKQRKFVAQVLGTFFQSAAYYTPVFFTVSYAKTLGFSDSDGANLTAVANACNAIGKIGVGFVADRIGRLNSFFLTTLLSAVVTLGLWVSSTLSGEHDEHSARGLFIAFTVLYGLFASAYVSLFTTSLVELFGMRELPRVAGVMFMAQGIASMIGTPVAGVLIRGNEATKTSEDYLGMAVLVGGLMFAAAASVAWPACDGIWGHYDDPFFGGFNGTHRKLRSQLRDLNRALRHVLVTLGSAQLVMGRPNSGPPQYATPEYLEELLQTYTDGVPCPKIVAWTDLSSQLKTQSAASQGTRLPPFVNMDIVMQLFQKQSAPWKRIVEFHIEKVMDTVKTFVDEALEEIVGPHGSSSTTSTILSTCVDPFFDKKEDLLSEKLGELLRPYKEGYALPLETDFREALERKIAKRTTPQAGEVAVSAQQSHLAAIPPVSHWNGAYVIFHTMETFYDSALRTFTDNVINLAIESRFIQDLPSIFTPRLVNGMTDDEVSHIAMESDDISSYRDALEEDIKQLKQGLEEIQKSKANASEVPSDTGLFGTSTAVLGLSTSATAPPAPSDAERTNASAFSIYSSGTPPESKQEIASRKIKKTRDAASAFASSPSVFNGERPVWGGIFGNLAQDSISGKLPKTVSGNRTRKDYPSASLQSLAK